MMNVSSSVLFFFSALGAFNGLLLAGYFFISKPRKIQHVFLALLLLMISTRIMKSVFFFFNPQLASQFLQVGLSACFLIGPFLYFYCASGQHKLSKYWDSWMIQLPILLGLIILAVAFFPYSRGSDVWNLFYRIINWQWLGYILLSAYLIRKSVVIVWKHRKAAPTNDIATVSVWLGVTLIWLAYFTSSYTSYIAGALSFSVVLYFNIVFFLLHRRHLNSSTSVEKYSDKKIGPEQAEDQITQLILVINEQSLFQDASLTLNKVAKKLGMSGPYLSQLLNDNMGLSFTNFINEYRIERAKSLLIENTQKIDDIAESCGFNSTSTFYAVFKKHTDLTPAKYRQSVLLEANKSL